MLRSATCEHESHGRSRGDKVRAPSLMRAGLQGDGYEGQRAGAKLRPDVLPWRPEGCCLISTCFSVVCTRRSFARVLLDAGVSAVGSSLTPVCVPADRGRARGEPFPGACRRTEAEAAGPVPALAPRAHALQLRDTPDEHLRVSCPVLARRSGSAVQGGSQGFMAAGTATGTSSAPHRLPGQPQRAGRTEEDSRAVRSLQTRRAGVSPAADVGIRGSVSRGRGRGGHHCESHARFIAGVF